MEEPIKILVGGDPHWVTMRWLNYVLPIHQDRIQVIYQDTEEEDTEEEDKIKKRILDVDMSKIEERVIALCNDKTAIIGGMNVSTICIDDLVQEYERPTIEKHIPNKDKYGPLIKRGKGNKYSNRF